MSGLREQNGFTLVELAIALMVIGLLIGGVLKGQELIENAKITATIRQLKAYDTATLIFRSTYNALPGDIKRPNRIPNCTEEICNIGGNGNGKVAASGDAEHTVEWYNFFPHLTKAGMIQGPQGGSLDDINADRELVFVRLSLDARDLTYLSYLEAQTEEYNGYATITMGHWYGIYGIKGQQAIALEEKLDDGYTHTGDIVTVDDMPSCINMDEYLYISESDACGILIKAGF